MVAPLLVAQVELLGLALERALLLREEHALPRRDVLERERAARVALGPGELLAREAPDGALVRDDLGSLDGRDSSRTLPLGVAPRGVDLQRTRDPRLELRPPT